MADERPLNIPVILGTTRQGRMSEHVARFMLGELQKQPGVTTELIDIAKVPMPVDDAGGAIKDPTFSAQMDAADGLVLVVPEYNHSFPGLLKHVLDSCLKEYVHKAASIVGVSAGSFGGARMIQNLIPVLRELGLVTIFWDVNFGNVGKVFDDSGKVIEAAVWSQRAEKFIKELLWMARTLRYGREHFSQES